MTPRVLFVDDDRLLLRAIERNIGDQFEVTLADSAVDAIERMESDGPFSVMVSDVKMPGMDGIRLVGRVRERWPAVKSIILTGNQDGETLDEVRNANAFRMLCKPSPHHRIAEAIVDALESEPQDSPCHCD